MNKLVPIIGSLIFFVVAPGTVAVFIPWLLTRWVPARVPTWYWLVEIPGLALVLLGSAILANAFVSFALEGRGTPAPLAPPKRLVVHGLYRYVRNPMYVGLVAVILGQALWLGRWELLAYAAVVWAITAAYVKWREEPVLARRFGAAYEKYCREVPAWIPRLKPWTPRPTGTPKKY